MQIFKLVLIAIFLTSGLTLNAQKIASVKYLDKITGAYLGIKNALVNNDGIAAEKEAKILFAALSAQPEIGLGPNEQKLLAAYVDKLKYDSRHISETDLIAHQREHFASLSKNLFEVLKGLKLNTTTLYEQYCPMKRSYWLSETSTIKNPYYGKQMLECGRTEATLKGVAR